jgi:hypothetical protein
MKKILSILGVAVVSALATYAVSYLQKPENYAKVSKLAKKYSAQLEKSAKAYSKKAKKLLSKKMKEYNL